MQVYVSNRLEELVAVLADRVAEPCPGGAHSAEMTAETIAVQGRGMERWLAMELSRRLGVWANPSFPFPRRLIERVFEAVLGRESGGARRFEPEAMTWKVAALLPGLLERDEFASIRSYLRHDESALRRIQLASRIAETFDHYVIYRPEMIRSWDRGLGQDGWQSILWQALVGQGAPDHLAARAEQFGVAIEAGEGAIEGLPSRIHLFGLTTLPPLYVDVLAALSKRVETNLFILGCTRKPEAGADANSLWTSLGSVGRDFHQVLAGRISAESGRAPGATGPDLFRDPGRGSILARLKRSLLEGETCQLPSGETDDRSIQIHACHGPMREVEVLHDQLTQLFEQDESLDPRDVLVMTPDIEVYAPFVEAVFGSARFAYHIADRGVRATHEIVDAFSRVLEVLQGRMTATGVVDLLMVDRIRRRFGIEAADLDVLLEWIEAAGIRWGVDAAHRSQVGQPASEQNTWRQGLDRMLLGLALPADGTAVFADLLPAPGVDLGRGDLLGRFAELCEALFALRESVQGTRSVEAWTQELAHVLETMVDRSDDAAEQHAQVRAALSDLTLRAKEAGFEEAVGLASVRHELMRQLERGVPSHRFLSGGVTFCEMVPMRSIPFRVVALLGMNDEAFPRNREPLGFDLMPASRRPGDRTARDDDRYLFLEALVSVREHLLVTYVGRSVRDGSEREPSVVIGELLDELGPEARARIVTEHPLQPFSPRYFDASDASLASYSAGDCAGAQALVDARAASGRERGPRLYVPAPIHVEGPDDMTVELVRLGRFFEHPVRAFLQGRLGLYLRDEVPQLEDREPLELDALAAWNLGDRLLGYVLAGVDPVHAKALLRAEGLLPLGSAGDLEAERAEVDAADLAAAVRELQRGDAVPPIEVDLRVGDWRIVGELGQLWPTGRVVVQFSKVPHRRELSFWVHHLVLSCVGGEGAPRTSFLAARDRASNRVVVLELPLVPDAEERLADLLALYALGQSVPLPLLPRASREQADFGHAKGWVDAPVPRATAAWEDDRGMPAERNDPYLRQVFRDVEPLKPGLVLPGGEGFASLARRIYEPYLLARVERT
jgi:exodeoxyribonuclease V gamma subunit